MSPVAIFHLPKWITINTLLPLRGPINNSTIEVAERFIHAGDIITGQPVAIHKSKSRYILGQDDLQMLCHFLTSKQQRASAAAKSFRLKLQPYAESY